MIRHTEVHYDVLGKTTMVKRYVNNTLESSQPGTARSTMGALETARAIRVLDDINVMLFIDGCEYPLERSGWAEVRARRA